MDVVCPILKTSDAASAAPAASTPVTEAPSAVKELEDAVTKPEAVTSNETISSGGFDEGFIQIKNTRIYGLRTYSIILIITLVYSYLCIKCTAIDSMRDLAIMACGFLFGTKTIRR
jgi:hypothetical protein